MVARTVRAIDNAGPEKLLLSKTFPVVDFFPRKAFPGSGHTIAVAMARWPLL